MKVIAFVLLLLFVIFNIGFISGVENSLDVSLEVRNDSALNDNFASIDNNIALGSLKGSLNKQEIFTSINTNILDRIFSKGVREELALFKIGQINIILIFVVIFLLIVYIIFIIKIKRFKNKKYKKKVKSKTINKTKPFR